MVIFHKSQLYGHVELFKHDQYGNYNSKFSSELVENFLFMPPRYWLPCTGVNCPKPSLYSIFLSIQVLMEDCSIELTFENYHHVGLSCHFTN